MRLQYCFYNRGSRQTEINGQYSRWRVRRPPFPAGAVAVLEKGVPSPGTPMAHLRGPPETGRGLHHLLGRWPVAVQNLRTTCKPKQHAHASTQLLVSLALFSLIQQFFGFDGPDHTLAVSLMIALTHNRPDS